MSAAETTMLQQRYPDTPTTELAIAMGRSMSSVYQHAYRLGLKKSPKFLREVHGANISKAGVAHRFTPGQAPHNKGVKGSTGNHPNCRQHHFRKGGTPANTKPDGYIRVQRDKGGKDYQYLRVRRGEFRLLSHCVWEQHNGPIREGHIIAFADGDTMNCDPANLRMISLADNMLRNSIHNYPPEVVRTMKTLGKLQRTIKTHGTQQDQ